MFPFFILLRSCFPAKNTFKSIKSYYFLLEIQINEIVAKIFPISLSFSFFWGGFSFSFFLLIVIIFLILANNAMTTLWYGFPHLEKFSSIQSFLSHVYVCAWSFFSFACRVFISFSFLFLFFFLVSLTASFFFFFVFLGLFFVINGKLLLV